MNNPATGYMTETRDITCLHHIHYSTSEVSDKLVVYPQVAIPLELEDVEAREGVMRKSKIESEEGEENNTVPMRSSRVMKPPVLYMNEYGLDGV